MQLRSHTRAPAARGHGRCVRPFVGTSPTRRCERGHRSLSPVQAAELVDAVAQEGPSGLLAAAALVPALGFAAYRFYVYSQLEYITAAMMTRHTPNQAPGPVVIQVGGGTKELYYWPKSVLQVTVVGEDINKSLLEQGGMQAAVPTVAKVQSPSNLRFADAGSVDAVATIGGVSKLGAGQAATSFLAEAARVLKPGRPLIFIEKDENTLFNILKARQNEWEDVEFDRAPDNHVVGVAIRAKGMGGGPAPGQVEEAPSAASLAKKKAKAKGKDDGKGFL